MKTSSIILSSAIGSISLLFVTGMIQMRLTSEPDETSELKSKEYSLSSYQHIVVEGRQNQIIYISSGDNFSISENQLERVVKHPKPVYHVNEDTLFLSLDNWTPVTKDGIRISFPICTLTIPGKSLETLNSKNAVIVFQDFSGVCPDMMLDNSRVTIKSDASMDILNVRAINNSSLSLKLPAIDSLHAEIDSSLINLSSSINIISGDIRNNASINTETPNKIILSNDQSVSMNFHK